MTSSPPSAGENLGADLAAPAGPSPRRLLWAGAAYAALLIVFWFIARFFHLKALDEHPVSTFLSFALVFAPYWFFGFGAATLLRPSLHTAAARLAACLLLVVPYFVLAIPRGDFQWPMAAALAGVAVLVTAALHYAPAPGNWADLAVLAAVGLIVDLGLLGHAWPFAAYDAVLWPPGMSGFPKLMLVNMALYGYLVVKPLDGVGYDLAPTFADLKIGLREFIFCAPIVIPLGFLLKFLHFHPGWPQPTMVPAGWIFTFVFIALPEELFFRGLAQNLLERRWGRTRALWATAVLFGLSHFNKGAAFNWKYVLLATIAGIFYGRAWRAQRRLFASSVTHASMDTVWSLWFR
ncbi:MAG: CPBP family intramembrane metalloprotease [Acidobacteriia bacterium]|nr:CPBP family intramembrane metalloprotease [Terriglobia bacterium]